MIYFLNFLGIGLGIICIYYLVSIGFSFIQYLLHRDVANWHTSCRIRYVSYETIKSMLDGTEVKKYYVYPTIHQGYSITLMDKSKYIRYHLSLREMIEVAPGMFGVYLICQSFSDYRKVVKYLYSIPLEH